MGSSKDPRIGEALRLARAGENEQARQLLVDILRRDSNNFDAWVVMAQVTDNQKEAITCMKQALRLRPEDERAQRYLDYLLHGDQQAVGPSFGKFKTSHWILASVSAAAIICLAVVLIISLPRLGSQEQNGQSGYVSNAQPVADCAALINDALDISDQGCQQIGSNEVCYGHNTIQAQLVPDAHASFDQPGKIIPINFLESFIASPLDTQKRDWGVGVFKLEANLPGTLPGQLVTMLVFGNTSLQNMSGDMQAFYFTSGLGGIKCDAVPFDGILVNMAEGAGISFQANGAGVTLQGSSILQAVADDSMVVTALRGMGTVRAFGRAQVLGAGRAVTVPLGGPNGMEADGPPNPPQPANDEVITADCALTGENCRAGDAVAAQVPPTSSVSPDPGRPTNKPVPAAPGRPTNTPVPLATNTPAPLPTNTPMPVVNTTTARGGGSTATSTSKPGVITSPPPTTPPTTPPPTTPPPTTPPPTTPPPTTPPPTDVCAPFGVSWGGINTNNNKVTIHVSSVIAATLETVKVTDWPSGNGKLQNVNDIEVNAARPTAIVTLSMPINGSVALAFKFQDNVVENGYSFTVIFSGGCEKQLTQN